MRTPKSRGRTPRRASRPRKPLIDSRRERFLEVASDVVGLANEIRSLEPSEQRALAQEVITVGDRLRSLSAEELSRLAGELKISTVPRPNRAELKVVGQDLARVGADLATLGLGLYAASAHLALGSRAKGPEDPKATNIFSWGADVGTGGDALSLLARRLLQLNEEQLLFLRILLGQARRARTQTPASNHGVVVRETVKEAVWGGIESEDLVRRKSRRPQTRSKRLVLPMVEES